MKVLGITEAKIGYTGNRAYIVQITHAEVREVADKAGYHDVFPDLKLNEEYPISEGYDFRAQILAATKAMVEAHAKFQSASVTMARFASLIASADAAKEVAQ